jgi:hypothetical protein
VADPTPEERAERLVHHVAFRTPTTGETRFAVVVAGERVEGAFTFVEVDRVVRHVRAMIAEQVREAVTAERTFLLDSLSRGADALDQAASEQLPVLSAPNRHAALVLRKFVETVIREKWSP